MGSEKISFKNAEVAAKYETDRTDDVVIYSTAYHGKLSAITTAGAAHLVKVNDKNIREKKADVKAVAVAAKP